MLCKDSNKTFTFFYNLILYLLLITKVPNNVLYTYLLFSVPILFIGEYIMWITKYYKKCNYTRPQLVFWNVNGDSDDFPVNTNDDNTALISGFSPSIMESILSTTNLSSDIIIYKTLNSPRLLPIRELLN